MRSPLSLRSLLKSCHTTRKLVPSKATAGADGETAAVEMASPVASSMLIQGKPIEVRALDAHTITVKLPSTYGPGLSFLDSIPILPAHKLRAALDAGKFNEAWGVTTPPAEIVGLGPFVIDSYKAGERLVIFALFVAKRQPR